MLDGIEITVSEFMTGAKYAVRFGAGPVIVSPAMWDLIRHADPAELRRLLEHIHILQLPPRPGRFEPLPMTTRPGDGTPPSTTFGRPPF